MTTRTDQAETIELVAFGEQVVASTEPLNNEGLSREVDTLLEAVEDHLRKRPMPSATYRVQFNSRCSFREVEAIVPYLYTLGISDLYASPFLQARPGSPHGYDIVDHSKINAEIGTIDDLRSLRSVLREHNMGFIADVVPNHMSATPKLNAWWQDVLENGQSSQYASHFDIDWSPVKTDLKDKVSLPLLGDQYGKVLEDGQLLVRYDEGTFWLQYFEHSLPIAPRSYSIILADGIDALKQKSDPQDESFLELLSILTAIRNLPARTETNTDRLAERRREKEIVKRRFNELVLRSPTVKAFIAEQLIQINGRRDDPRSFDRLDELLQEQVYRLSYWRVAADEINYRRFFDINELAAICPENPQVFDDVHRLLFELIDEGVVTSLRIDHPDGLYDPRGYFVQLQERHFRRLCREAYEQRSTSQDDESNPDRRIDAWPMIEQRIGERWQSAAESIGSPLARPLYIVVEKILAVGESLPEDWPVHGTVGYEVLNSVNGLFVDPAGERALTTLYSRFIDKPLDYDELVYRGKRLIVRVSMASELMVLGHRLDRISERNRWSRDFTINSLTRALQEVIAGFRVYRSYVQPGRVLERDRDCIEGAVTRAKRRNPAIDSSVFDFVRDVLLLRFHETANEVDRQAIESFAGKFQQLTGPIMAKAVEDTTFYRFNRLVSLNEVGGEPERFGVTAEAFHDLNRVRQLRFPQALTASTTHDTKRSEDVRARINVLSEIEKTWQKHVNQWSRWNQKHKVAIDGDSSPSRNAEYLLYQTLVGTWPTSNPTGLDLETYTDRIKYYMLKVEREAKVNTSWVNPNSDYEASVTQFVESVLSPSDKNRFLKDLSDFAGLVAGHGYWNSLSQLVLKIASPGVPDFFQGTELWNLTLVDPDNRQPVDFAVHRQALDRLRNEMAGALGLEGRDSVVEKWLDADNVDNVEAQVGANNLICSLMENRDSGMIKLFVSLVSLRNRRRQHRLFTAGEYEPLEVIGSQAHHLVAFARLVEDKSCIVMIPRFSAKLNGLGGPPPTGECWQDTHVVLPERIKSLGFVDVYTRQHHVATSIPDSNGLRIDVAKVLNMLPVCMLNAI
ncbi:MAG: malto-oligosyltrehalose synthase [Pirellulaceae bacterium]|nr:malto-oligosyltrehalose synthase [Pirellulaceae bacterium]